MGKEKEVASLNLIYDEVKETKRLTEENNRSIHGYAGQPGLYSLYTTLCGRMDMLEKLMSNDLSHLTAKIDLMFAGHENKDKAVSDTEAVAVKRVRELEDANLVKKTDILKEWVKPIVVSILTAILVWFIVTNGIAGK